MKNDNERSKSDRKKTDNGLYRSIQVKLWSDSKVIDDFTVNDTYLFLYLLTSPLSNNIGLYEITKRQMAYDTKLTNEEIEETLKRLEQEHKVISYDNETKEVLLLNFGKYNFNSPSPTNLVNLNKYFSKIKSKKLIELMKKQLDKQSSIYSIDTLSHTLSIRLNSSNELEQEEELEQVQEDSKKNREEEKRKKEKVSVSRIMNLRNIELNSISDSINEDFNQVVKMYDNYKIKSKNYDYLISENGVPIHTIDELMNCIKEDLVIRKENEYTEC